MLILPNDEIVLGISGGRDSVCLALLLENFRAKIPFSVRWVPFNHKARQTADRDQDFVEQLATSTGNKLEVFVRHFSKDTADFQNEARQWRLDNMKKVAGSGGKIALGHHQDDLIETFLWKLSRGSSLLGLNAMKRRTDNVIRPLLGTSRNAITEWLFNQGQSWVDDESNETKAYTRNIIRHELVKKFEELFGESFKSKIVGIVNDIELIEEDFNHNTKDLSERKDLDFKEIEALPKYYGREAVSNWLVRNGFYNVDRQRIEIIHNLILSGTGGWQIDVGKGACVFGKNKIAKIIR